ncbi:MAG: caspase family protein, partial [Myxococcota bacterium]
MFRFVCFGGLLAAMLLASGCGAKSDPEAAGRRGIDRVVPVAPIGIEEGKSELGIRRYRAVLFSVQDYARGSELTDLSTPTEDVRRISSILGNRFGFETEVVENASEAQIIETLDRLRSESQEDDALLIYYAGHGVYDAGEDRGYWLPSDAQLGNTSRWVSNDDVAAKMRAIPARHVLLVVDSCFSGKFKGGGAPGSDRALADLREARKLARNRSRWIISSGGNEPVADGGRDGMSVFAYYFADALSSAEERYVTPDVLFPHVRRRVSANADQTPSQGQFAASFHEDGQFVFLNGEACEAEIAREQRRAQAQATAQWANVRAALGGTPEDAQAALKTWLDRWELVETVQACGEEVPVQIGELTEARWLLRLTEPKAATRASDEAYAGNAPATSDEPSRSVPEWRKACEAGEMGACRELGLAHEGGFGVDLDLARAFELYTQACNGGDAAACGNLGVLYARGDGTDVDYDKALAKFTQGCMRRDARSCSLSGVVYEQGLGVDEDASRANERFQQGCDGGHPEGCSWLGYNLQYGVGASVDAFAARTAYRRACEGGSPDGCVAYGLVLEQGAGGPPDLDESTGAYEAACDKGNGLGCAFLGLAASSGTGTAMDTVRAETLFRQACDLGEGRGCYWLGLRKEGPAAVALYEQGCSLEWGPSCHSAGVAYREGDGVQADNDNAVSFYERACTLQSGGGCTNLGWMYESGYGVSIDLSAATTRYLEGCALDDPVGCANAAYMLENGRGVATDHAEAR